MVRPLLSRTANVKHGAEADQADLYRYQAIMKSNKYQVCAVGFFAGILLSVTAAHSDPIAPSPMERKLFNADTHAQKNVSPAAGVQQGASTYSECYGLDGPSDTGKCLENQVKQSDGALQQAQASLLSAFDRSTNAKAWKSRVAAKLNNSTKSFRGYQDAQCELQAALAAGVDEAGERRLVCIIELNESRAMMLREAAVSLP
jgi:uncharacterized protein YecT (DUF1311 family)